MNWDAISTIAEVVGAAAGVGTLIYLAIQIRQGNDTDRVQLQGEVCVSVVHESAHGGGRRTSERQRASCTGSAPA